MNKKDFDVREVITKRVQREADWDWALTPNNTYIPEFQKTEVLEDNSGWLNLFKDVLLKVRP